VKSRAEASGVSGGTVEVGISVEVGDGGASDGVEEVVDADSVVLDVEVELDGDGAGVELAPEVDEAIVSGKGVGEGVAGAAGGAGD